MPSEMVNPHDSLVSFQECILQGMIPLAKVPGYSNLYSYVDEASPGVMRFTYARMTDDRRTVKAFCSCVKNGFHDGHPCISIGYAVPEQYRNRGYGTAIVKEAVNDLLSQAHKGGIPHIVIDSVVSKENVASQRVTESALQVIRESIIDTESGQPAFQYTAVYSTVESIL
ncbi:GNAT family N-acetyltransferase [Alteromonas gilva]|uniref:GNAT family N-acetyltransferase n=1 Tax=Alteromonas gilva TaxID=2987522 RepID=A0ABT5L791_9ALTE|nr:GNAT family N-acetyltransferase [Alteromonas gilva]MDC8832906.1 GNAT family N-acetyltransferase [Alteromonas gilva]